MNALKINLTSLFKSLICLAILLTMGACASTQIEPKKKTSKADQDRHERAMIHTRLAQGYMHQNQNSTAKTELDRALAISPNHSDSNYVMALLMMRLEQYSSAKRYFARAVKYDSQNSMAAHDYGIFLCQLGEREKAVDW